MESKDLEMFASIYKALNNHLNEKQRRLLFGAAAEFLGSGGLKTVCKITGAAKDTVIRGKKEVRGEITIKEEQTRHSGGGRKKIEDQCPEILVKLQELVDSSTRGDPESPLLYTSKSLVKLSNELTKLGYGVSDNTVRRLLHKLGFTLQANKKVLEGKASHPDRDAQFQYINTKVKEFMKEGQVVISVNTKKKEKVGLYNNQGSEWNSKGDPQKTLDHDFGIDKISPFGIYDQTDNKGFVNVGTDKDTSAYAVESIRRWWRTMGYPMYPNAHKILIAADCGGSNGYRSRLWKSELQIFANETGLDIHVCHFPPGTSKWNKIEHRMFSYISMNWRGRPLISHEIVVNLISSTKTQKGLKIKCEMDYNRYPTGIKVSEERMKELNIIKDDFHGEWNYAVKHNK